MLKIVVENDNTLMIDGSKRAYLILLRNRRINIEYQILESCNIVFVGQTQDIELYDRGFIKNDLEVNVTYINLERGTYVQESNIDVLKGAKLNVTSKYLTIDEKIINLNYINKDRYSEVNIDNSCVCLDKSVLKLDCTGKIEKGAKVSKNHQSSRCLTIDNPKKAEIKPILLIDENDVEASHSLSSGTIDQDVLFYLYSRGISYHDAMILFIHSYLLPQEEVFDGIDDAGEIISYLNEKVVNIYA
ncbi:MAG: SufD family Fe-S cluster assembly protein [Erysipelotrichaceae bacterium]